jgi:hypothetical protein
MPAVCRDVLLWCVLFGPPELLAALPKLQSSEERVPTNTVIKPADFKKVAA